MFKYVVSSHLNPNLSGVAKFNQILAKRLGVSCVGLEDVFSLKIAKGPFLLSIKLRDNNGRELKLVRDFLSYAKENNITCDVFFHTFDGLEIEDQLLQNCRQVFCGNSEIENKIQRNGKRTVPAWCPSLIDTQTAITESKLNLFSFGMAHKLQVDYYRLLGELLQKSNLDYSLWVSTAFHEKANFGEFDTLSSQLVEIFGPRIQFLGFLSDEAINYFLKKTFLFVAFFEKGVRANNTTVNAAMVRGCAVLTNCDEYSPPWLQHGKNMLDIHQVRQEHFDVDILIKIGKQAQQDVHEHASWNGLIKLLEPSV